MYLVSCEYCIQKHLPVSETACESAVPALLIHLKHWSGCKTPFWPLRRMARDWIMAILTPTGPSCLLTFQPVVRRIFWPNDKDCSEVQSVLSPGRNFEKVATLPWAQVSWKASAANNPWPPFKAPFFTLLTFNKMGQRIQFLCCVVSLYEDPSCLLRVILSVILFGGEKKSFSPKRKTPSCLEPRWSFSVRIQRLNPRALKSAACHR